jgi:hypothetical protein
MLDATVGGELPFEPVDEATAGADPALVERLVDILSFAAPEIRFGDGNEWGDHTASFQ